MIFTDVNMEKITLDCDKGNEIEMENISEREEGEISDLDFEDISDDDNSLIEKSQVNPKFTHGSSSLSSISESDLDNTFCVNSNNVYQSSSRRRYRYRRKRSTPSSKSSSKTHSNKMIKSIKSRRRKSSSHFNDRFYLNSNLDPSNDKHLNSYILSKGSSESEGETVDRSMLKKLNKAVCVNSVSLDKHTSLSTRLKNMINISNGEKNESSDSDYDLTTLREMALQTKPKASIENKNPIEPKGSEPRKSIDEAEQLRLDALRTAILKKHQARCEKRMKQKVQNSEQKSESLTEAKHVLDSLIDNAIMQVESQNQLELPTDNNKENQLEATPQTWEEDEDILRAKLLSSVAKKLSATTAPPIVTKSIQSQSIQKPMPEIKKYLEAPLQHIIIKVDDSDSDSDSYSSEDSNINHNQLQESLSQLLKTARAEVERKQKSETNPSKPTQAQSRQAEYLQLKQRLEFLNKNRNDLINNNQKLIKSTTTIPKADPIKFPAVKKNGIPFNKRKVVHNPNEINTKFPSKTTVRKIIVPNRTSLIQTSQKRILDGKYLNLVPIVKKAKAAKLARDNASAEVQRLMLQLQKAKERHIAFHQQYKNYVHEYIALKATIDKKAAVSSNLKKRNTSTSVEASDAKRVKTQSEPSEIQNAETRCSDVTQEKVSVEATASPIDENEPKIIAEESSRTITSQSGDKVVEDIHEKRNRIDSNPQIVMCPFDLQGTCKDLECPYRHFGKCS